MVSRTNLNKELRGSMEEHPEGTHEYDEGVECDFCHGMTMHTPKKPLTEQQIHEKEEHSPYDVQIMLVSGYNEPERATAGLLMAMACATSFSNVVIFLIMNAVELAAVKAPIKVRIEPFDYMDVYMDHLVSLGVKIEVCSSCIKKFYPQITAENSHEFVRPEAQVIGMVEVAVRAKTTRTLMF